MNKIKWVITLIGALVLFFGLYKLSLINPEVNALGTLASLGSLIMVFAQFIDD